MDANTATVKGLGLLAKAFLWLGIPATTAYLATAYPTSASLLPVILLPTIGAMYKRQNLLPGHRAKLSTLAYVFWTVGTIGVAGVMALQGLGLYSLATLLFGPEDAQAYLEEFGVSTLNGLSVEDIARRARMAKKWEYFALLAVFTYVLAGGLEELLKYAPIFYMRRNEPDPRSRVVRAQIYMQYALAAALGFSTIENLGMTMAAVKAGEGPLKIAVMVVERVALSAPGHMLCAAMLAINAARVTTSESNRKFWNLWRIVGTSVLYHGTFDFMLFSISAWNGNVGWIHPTDVTSNITGLTMMSALQGALAMQVWQGWKALETEEDGKPAAAVQNKDSPLDVR